MSREEKERKQKEPFFSRGFWIAFLVSFLVGCALGAGIGMIEYFAQQGAGYSTNILAISVDSAALSGLLLICSFLLQFFSTLGAFDFLAYSMKVLVFTIFKPRYRQEGFPLTYYDYKVMKDHEGRKPMFALLISGSIFLLAGIILYIVYKTR